MAGTRRPEPPAGPVTVVLAGTLASALRVGAVAARDRGLAPFAMFLLVMFGFGLALTSVTGDARFVLATWAELERADQQWREWNEPGWERFGLTVTPTDQHV